MGSGVVGKLQMVPSPYNIILTNSIGRDNWLDTCCKTQSLWSTNNGKLFIILKNLQPSLKFVFIFKRWCNVAIQCICNSAIWKSESQNVEYKIIIFSVSKENYYFFETNFMFEDFYLNWKWILWGGHPDTQPTRQTN